MNLINSLTVFLSNFFLWILHIAICEEANYAAVPLGHYYAGKADLRLHYTKESPWRGKKENSAIYKYGTVYKTPDYNTYMNKSRGINYADKGQYGRPRKGYLPVLGGYAGGVKPPPVKYGSAYDQDAEDLLYKQPGKAYMYYPSPTPGSSTTVGSTSTTMSPTSATTEGESSTGATVRWG